MNKKQIELSSKLLKKITDAEEAMKKAPGISSFWLKKWYGLISYEAPLNMRLFWGIELDRDCVEQILTLQIDKWKRELKELGIKD